MSESELRRTIYYSGRVQGVGFRATAHYLSRNFSMTGFVRNLADGRVEMIVEGHSEQLDQFQKAIADRMRAYIRQVTVSEQPATGQFSEFSIAG